MIDGTKLRQHREARGLSQAALAAQSGIASTKISGIERNTDLTIDYYVGTAKRLADALGCTVDDLLVEDDEEERKWPHLPPKGDRKHFNPKRWNDKESEAANG